MSRRNTTNTSLTIRRAACMTLVVSIVYVVKQQHESARAGAIRAPGRGGRAYCHAGRSHPAGGGNQVGAGGRSAAGLGRPAPRTSDLWALAEPWEGRHRRFSSLSCLPHMLTRDNVNKSTALAEVAMRHKRDACVECISRKPPALAQERERGVDMLLTLWVAPELGRGGDVTAKQPAPAATAAAAVGDGRPCFAIRTMLRQGADGITEEVSIRRTDLLLQRSFNVRATNRRSTTKTTLTTKGHGRGVLDEWCLMSFRSFMS
jgi:hypothetical protein